MPLGFLDIHAKVVMDTLMQTKLVNVLEAVTK